jgi:hypothetical protein
MNKIFIIVTIGLMLSIYGYKSTYAPNDYQKFRIDNIQKNYDEYWTADLYDINTDSLAHKSYSVHSNILSKMIEYDSKIITLNMRVVKPYFFAFAALTAFLGTVFICFLLSFPIIFFKKL